MVRASAGSEEISLDIVLFVLGIVLLVALVALHELGHAIVARRNGVVVEEYGIGFPPKAWARKLKNGTLFTLNWLPLGGFVKLKGEHDSAKGEGTYGGATLLAKSKILMAGVLANWLIAVVIFTVLALVGMPKVLPNQFGVPGDTYINVNNVVAAEVTSGSPAEKAGVKPGDKLISIAGESIKDAKSFSKQTAANAGKTVDLGYSQSGKTKHSQVTLNKDNKAGKGFIGIGPAEQTLQRATWSAPIVGVGVTVQFTYETFKGLAVTIGDLFQTKFEQAGSNVAGPIGIISILKDSSTLGLVPVLFLIGIISLTLAVMNVLPIPALDGGRLFVTLLFRAFKKPLTEANEEKIQFAGFIALMLLVLLVTIVDVRRFL